jgi:hypothetical protein
VIAITGHPTALVATPLLDERMERVRAASGNQSTASY